jgi:hypothetical protein
VSSVQSRAGEAPRPFCSASGQSYRMSSRLLDLCRVDFVGELRGDERRAESGSFGFVSSSVKDFVGGVAAVQTFARQPPKLFRVLTTPPTN